MAPTVKAKGTKATIPTRNKKPEMEDNKEKEDDKDKDNETGRKKKKTQETPIDWKNNPDWTRCAINYLLENPHFHIKLFSMPKKMDT